MRETTRTANVTAVHPLAESYVLKLVAAAVSILASAIFLPTELLAIDTEIYRQDDDIDRSAVFGNGLVANPDDTVTSDTDFNGPHTLNVYYGQTTQGDYDNSSSVDALNVFWLGEVPKTSVARAQFRFPQPRDAMRVRNRDTFSTLDGGFQYVSAGEFQSGFLLVSDAEFDAKSRIDNRVGIAYGVGTIGSDDTSGIQFNGYSIIGDLSWSAGIQNQIIGPKSGVVFQRRLGKWSFDSQAIATVGANFSQIDRRGSTGTALIPGALNRPLYARPTSYFDESNTVGLSPAGVLHATLYYDLTESITFRTAWSSLVMGNLLQVGDPVYAIPNGRFRLDSDTYTLHQIFCGVEYVR
jgi:hypothetical protein